MQIASHEVDIQKNGDAHVRTEYEKRGFGGRGSFVNGLGQVRDMVRRHVLQVPALTGMDPSMETSAAIFAVFDSLTLVGREWRQFDVLLESHKLEYHPEVAESTSCRVRVKSSMDA